MCVTAMCAVRKNHKRIELWRSANMLGNYARGCLVFMVLSSISNKSDSLEIKSALVVEEGGYGGGKLHEKQFHSPQDASRWRREGAEAADNELDSHESSNRKKLHRSQLEYTCGKAVAEKKYRDFFLNESGYQVSRNKYRPTEIRMPRIIGGDDTTPGEFPWTVSVKLNGQPICGGSLIDSSWILTAAHCVVGYNPKNLTIRSGAYRIKDSSETQTVDSAVSMFIIHKEYSIPRPFSNDIALLKLTEPLEYSDFIVPVCLPRPESSSTLVADDVATNTITGDYSATQVAAELQRSSNETGGIVVSTKMSDVDIAQCFTRIEQNYLNSIGMGSTPEPPVSQVQPSVAPINYLFVQQPTPDHHLLAPADVGLEKGSPQRNREHVTQHLRLKPSQAQQYKMQQYLAQMIYQLNGNNNNNNNNQLENYDWLTQSQARGELEKKSQRKEQTIKLSRLPISKELLHEIQSVGSGPMQTLVLNQGYFTNGDFANQLAASQQQIVGHPQAAPEREKVSVYLNNQKNQQAAVAAQLQSPDDPSKYSIGVSGTVVGWGWVRETESGEDTNNKGHSSTTLQKVKLPILHNSVCESWFQSQSKKITLLPSQFCAGFSSGGKDACRGDSGGPMIIEDELDADRYTLIGIVSAGIGCARPSLPGLYTRVASFLPWIRAQMNRY